MNTMDTIQKQFFEVSFKRHNKRNLFILITIRWMPFITNLRIISLHFQPFYVKNHFSLHYLHELNLFKRRMESREVQFEIQFGCGKYSPDKTTKSTQSWQQKEWTRGKGTSTQSARGFSVDCKFWKKKGKNYFAWVVVLVI